MNPVLLYFASGESLYSGAALLLLIVASAPYLTSPFLSRMRNIVIWLALALIIMACPPFPWSVDAIFGAVFLVWFIAWNKEASGWVALRTTTGAAMFVFVVALSTAEFSHRMAPALKGDASDHLVVIGDSISSGLEARVPPWPAVMQQMTGVDVRNLSRPGATVTDGVVIAEKVNADDRLILIELGGNDLIAGEQSDVFGRGLDQILVKLIAPGRTLVMFELPLLPDRVAYGQIQRRLAVKYGVSLIPKRYLTEVIAGPEATSDGLHLTDIGARRMAAVVGQVLLPVLKARPDKPTTPATHP